MLWMFAVKNCYRRSKGTAISLIKPEVALIDEDALIDEVALAEQDIIQSNNVNY